VSEGIPLNLKCSNCGAEMPPPDRSGVARCGFCQHEFRAAAPTPQPQVQIQQVVVREVIRVPVPVVAQPKPGSRKDWMIGCGVLAMVGGMCCAGGLISSAGRSTSSIPHPVPSSIPSVPPVVTAPTPSVPATPPMPMPSPRPSTSPHFPTKQTHYTPQPSRTQPQQRPVPNRTPTHR
jgi:hypothetical protein